MSTTSSHDARAAGPLDGWVAVVLAAGRGTRMRSRTPKALHPVAGRPMLHLVCDALTEAGIERLVVVSSDTDDEVARSVEALASVAAQGEPLGTGHAALAARAAAGDAAHVLIVNADLPLLTAGSLRALALLQAESSAALAFLTADVDDPSGYGRVLRSNGRGAPVGAVSAVIEETETDPATRAIREVNVGVYAGDASWLWNALAAIRPGPRGEVYLPDLVPLALDSGRGLLARRIDDPGEARQVNTRVELARAERALRDRVREQLMLAGVTLVDPPTTFVDVGVEVGEDTTLLPGIYIEGSTSIGRECRVGPHTVLRDMRVGDRCTIGPSTLEGSQLGDDVEIGSYCRVRPGTLIEEGAHLGTFAEVKASRVGPRTAIGHFSYIGDSDVGADVNIGAGTVTTNYDGVAKHRTEIGDGAFIGSDSMLVAPVRIGAGARTAAGAVVTHDVADGATVMGVPARVRDARAAEREGS